MPYQWSDVCDAMEFIEDGFYMHDDYKREHPEPAVDSNIVYQGRKHHRRLSQNKVAIDSMKNGGDLSLMSQNKIDESTGLEVVAVRLTIAILVTAFLILLLRRDKNREKTK